jgi:hypothetical protein
MTENTYTLFDDVKRFMNAAEQSPDESTANLYLNLINEEMNEFSEAVEGGNDVATLDAICDTIWVLIGYAHSKGYPVDMAWDAVALSNFSKCITLDGKLTTVKREDGKVIKGPYFKPPKIRELLRESGFTC